MPNPTPNPVSAAPVMPTPPVQGRQPLPRPTPPGAPPPSKPQPDPETLPGQPQPPQPGQGLAPQSIHTIVHNGRNVDVSGADMTKFAQMGYDLANNAEKQQRRERADASAQKWAELQKDMGRLPDAARQHILQVFRTGQVGAAPGAAPVSNGSDDDDIQAEDPRIAQLQMAVQEMSTQLRGFSQDQANLERDTRVATALGGFETFAAAEDRNIAGLLVNAVTLAEPNITPEDAAAYVHNELMGFAGRRAKTVVDTRINQQDLNTVPPTEGTPELNQIEKPKITADMLKNGGIRKLVADLADRSGARAMLRGEGGVQPPE